MIDAVELVDNDFLRQFELKVEGQLAKIEYSLQGEKINTGLLIYDDEELVELEDGEPQPSFGGVGSLQPPTASPPGGTTGPAGRSAILSKLLSQPESVESFIFSAET